MLGYKLWCSGKIGGVGVMVKEELCEKAAEVGRVNERVITVVRGYAEVDSWVCSTR